VYYHAVTGKYSGSIQAVVESLATIRLLQPDGRFKLKQTSQWYLKFSAISFEKLEIAQKFFIS